MIKFYGYKACGTSRKGEKFLQEMGVDYEFINITESAPSLEELKQALQFSGLPVTKAFNTSGMVYKEGDYKTKLKTATEEEMLNWLAANGRLIKRPLLLGTDKATIGVKEEEFKQTWKA